MYLYIIPIIIVIIFSVRLQLRAKRPWTFKKQINDDKFGLIWFNKDKNPEFNHYQGHFVFKPTNSEIDIFVDSDEEGIKQGQKKVFDEIEKKYDDIITQIVSQIECFLNKRKNPENELYDFKKDFTLITISISRLSSLNQKWTLSFSSKKYSLTEFTIQFKNWDVVEIRNYGINP